MVEFTEVMLYYIGAMKGTTIKHYFKHLVLPLAVALFVMVVFTDTALAQETPPVEPTEPTDPDLNTGTLDIQENPIYTRLIQFINFLSFGVTIVIALSVIGSAIQYSASRGDPNQTAAAVKRMTQAGIAVFMYVFGWAILNWLIPGGVLN